MARNCPKNTGNNQTKAWETTTNKPTDTTPTPKLTKAQQICTLEESMAEEESRVFGCPRHGPGFLVCQSLMVASTPASVAHMYSTQKNSMTILLTVNMWHKMTQTEALLGCGTTHNFIDPQTIKTLSMGTNPLKQPLLVHNVDGTITHYCNLWVRHGKQVEKLGFYVANLGRDRIILGYPWFQKFNPQFEWNTHTLKGDEVEIDTVGYRTKLATSL